MEDRRFTILLAGIAASIAALISEAFQIGKEEALLLLYASELYSVLEREETKLWHYSYYQLYHIYLQEKETEELLLPTEEKLYG